MSLTSKERYERYSIPRREELYIPSLFCDGGLVGQNPSKKGGTWAWCWVDGNGLRVHQGSGAVTPEDLQVTAVTNNHTELYAAFRAIDSVGGPSWRGTLHTDSKVTMLRLTSGNCGYVGLPQWMVKKVFEIRRYRRFGVALVAGHPTRKELASGVRNRNGLPASAHNQWCDEACTKAGQILKRG